MLAKSPPLARRFFSTFVFVFAVVVFAVDAPAVIDAPVDATPGRFISPASVARRARVSVLPRPSIRAPVDARAS